MPDLLDGLGILNPATALAGVTSLGGDYMQYRGQQETNAANVALTREQMGFQERMSSTAYQRAVKDLERAGLNPMLALMHGGASTPAGSAARLDNPMGHMSGAVGRVVASAGGVAQVANVQADTDLKAATAAQVRANTAVLREEVPRIIQEVSNLRTEGDVIALKRRLLDMDVDKLRQVIPELIKQEKAKTVLMQAGRESLSKLPAAERSFWLWLNDVGSRLGLGAAEMLHGGRDFEALHGRRWRYEEK